MKFSPPLIQAKFLKRYKRFFADFELDGKVYTAHCANTGSLKNTGEANCQCLLSKSDDPNRKLAYSLQALQSPSSHWVGVNTSITNKLVFEAFENKIYPHWQAYENCASEIKIHAETRIDFIMWSKDNGFVGSKPKASDFAKHKFHFIEVKNVSMVENNIAMFPDAETIRGQKHLEELMQLQQQGHTCEIFFCIQRNDVQKFVAAKHIDAKYAELLQQAKKTGVKVSAYTCNISADCIKLTNNSLM